MSEPLYQVELVWNREFHFVPYLEPFKNREDAERIAEIMLNSGDGERVKKARVVEL